MVLKCEDRIDNLNDLENYVDLQYTLLFDYFLLIFEAFVEFQGVHMSVFPYFLIMQVFFYVDNVFELAGILDCGVVSLPLKYIGLPLGASHKAMHIWDGVIEDKMLVG
jgi:hypothetical protein